MSISTTTSALSRLHSRIIYSNAIRNVSATCSIRVQGCGTCVFRSYSSRITRSALRGSLIQSSCSVSTSTRWLRPFTTQTETTDTSHEAETSTKEEEEDEDDTQLMEPLGQCPGCGIQLQCDDPFLPGYIPDTLTYDDISSSSVVEIDDEMKGRKTNRSTTKSLSDEDFNRLVAELPEELRKEFIPLVDTTEQEEVAQVSSTTTTTTQIDNQQALDEMETIANEEDEEATPEATPIRICQRCHSLRFQHSLPSTQTEMWGYHAPELNEKAIKMLHQRHGAIVLLVIDLFDFPGSLSPALIDIAAKCKRLIVVPNKLDILPETTQHGHIKKYVKEALNRLGIHNIDEIVPVSARTNVNLSLLVRRIQKLRTNNENIYLIGSVNAGKSALMNAFLRYSQSSRTRHQTKALRLTTSPIPGTTMATRGISIDDLGGIFDSRKTPALLIQRPWRGSSKKRLLYDMPGMLVPNQLINFLEPKELMKVEPKSSLKPKTYRISPGESIFLGGLARLDFTEGDRPMLITVSSVLRPHFTNIKRADELQAQLVDPDSQWPAVLSPPCQSSMRLKPYPPLKKAIEVKAYGQHDQMACLDVVWSGVGWFALAGRFPPVVLHTWSPNGIGVYTRPSLLPYAFTGKVAKRSQALRKTPA
ncbi:hypothetical protein BDF22DRAFT_420648 [Syncephalis plumigaleata]|nr:hypothetical protein BDF22DRAFT_420648 [Syncephalis plumigaleata]